MLRGGFASCNFLVGFLVSLKTEWQGEHVGRPYGVRRGGVIASVVVCVRILSMSENANGPLVSVIMGSRSDLPTMHHAADVLRELGVVLIERVAESTKIPSC